MRIGIMSLVTSYLKPLPATLEPTKAHSAEPEYSGPYARTLLDETVLLEDDEIKCLAARGAIFLTRRNDLRFGAIIADSINLAMARADIQNGSETVLGLMDASFLPHLRGSTVATNPPRNVIKQAVIGTASAPH